MRFGRQKEGRIPPDLTDDVDIFSEKKNRTSLVKVFVSVDIA